MQFFRLSAIICALTLGAFAVNACSFQAGTGGQEAKPPPPPPPPPKKKEKKEKKPKKEQPAATPAPTPAPTPTGEIVTKGNTIVLPGNIVFDSGKSTLKEGENNDAILEQLKKYMETNTKVTLLRVEGHTDNVGQSADNLKLSGDRALTIKRWLVDHGIEEKRIIAVGFGQNKPIADNNTEEGKAQNRRTEFKMAEVNGKPYLGMDPKAGGTEFK